MGRGGRHLDGDGPVPVSARTSRRATANETLIAPGQPDYLWARVADHLAARIEAGELVPGARLPRELDLADQYEVSHGTMRRAIAELRRRGLVRTLPNLGTFILATR
jgi:GntR family transcriptional regulator